MLPSTFSGFAKTTQTNLTSAPQDNPNLSCTLWSPHMTQTQIIPGTFGGSVAWRKEHKFYS